jgi:hypothetical protein
VPKRLLTLQSGGVKRRWPHHLQAAHVTPLGLKHPAILVPQLQRPAPRVLVLVSELA